MNYKIRSCNWYWYVKGIRRGICHIIHQYAKANNKYMKDLIKVKNFHIVNIGMWLICMIGQCHKSCL